MKHNAMADMCLSAICLADVRLSAMIAMRLSGIFGLSAMPDICVSGESSPVLLMCAQS